ncbi:MAG: CBS domain-containing protein, partial [Rhodospirillaceae bacterium]
MTETSQSELDRARTDSDLTIMDRIRAWFSWGGSDTGSVRDVIEELIEDQPDTDDAIDAHERILLSNVLSQRDVTVEKIMVPRADIVSVDLETAIVDVVALLVEEGHSRVPVFRGSLDEVVGMVHIKDLANALIEQKSSDNVFTDL